MADSSQLSDKTLVEKTLLGDNRSESYDSRMSDMGAVDADAFTGRVRWVLWPLDRFGGVK